MTHLKIGDKAPEFINNSGNISLKSLKGKKVILYFYPKDNTPGCTAEACNLRDNIDILKTKGFDVIGVSPDNEKSHEKFKSKFELPFALIADDEKTMLKNYGVWGQKKMYGKSFEGVIRTTFIISENGLIEDIIEDVKTKEHAEQILSKYK
jgi:thioredoxin-dependent peroxiredoxin